MFDIMLEKLKKIDEATQEKLQALEDKRAEIISRAEGQKEALHEGHRKARRAENEEIVAKVEVELKESVARESKRMKETAEKLKAVEVQLEADAEAAAKEVKVKKR
jgi:hypothetical protein